MERPDGIIITISQEMLKEKGLKNWLQNFYNCMKCEGCAYYMRLGTIPKQEVLYVYLLIGGKIRYRALCVGYEKDKTIRFDNGKEMYAKAWVTLTGPIVKPKVPVERKGFRGFRYTELLF
jgi:hypothetical protein